MLMMERVELDKSKIQGRFIYHFFKRTLDIVASGLALILLSPLFLVVGIMIKHEDGGSVFYHQIRIGKNGHPFKMWKLRSMVENADQMKEELLEQNEIDGAMFKIKDDPRVTKVGKWIRKYSIDELPQLYNVLIGDMSLVGPRPPLPDEVENYTDYDKLRLTVTPGCTGLWQVTKRNNADFSEMVELDLEYINHSGFWYDLYLITKTFGVMIHPNGAY